MTPLTYREAATAINQIKHGNQREYSKGLQTIGYATVSKGDHMGAQLRYNQLTERYPRHFCLECCKLGELNAGKQCNC